MPYLLMLGYLLTRTFSAVTTKSNSRSYSALGAIGSFLYIFVTAVYSLFFFWALNGFVLTINTTVIIYGALYAGIVIMNLVPTVFMYNYGSITSVSFISNTISLIASAIAGVLVFSEAFTLDKLVRIAIMLLCVFIIFIGSKRSLPEGEPRGKSRFHPLGIILPAAVALVTVAATSFIKTYGNDPLSTDINSFYFMTNVFLFFYTPPIIFVLAGKRRISLREVGKMIIDKRSAVLLLNTALGSVQSVIVAMMIASMDVAVYTALTSALGFIALAIATPLVRERLDRYTLAATVLAVLSIVIPLFIT